MSMPQYTRHSKAIAAHLLGMPLNLALLGMLNMVL